MKEVSVSMDSEYQITFTDQDRIILESYSRMMEGLALYFGEAYEFVLHSLEDLDHSAIKVINGVHTGRREGAPITNLALQMLDQIKHQNGEDYVCYHAVNAAGHPLHSTTIAIHGTENRIIALLCINCYLDIPFSKFLETFSAYKQPSLQSEQFLQSGTEMVENMIQEIALEVGSDETIPVSAKKKEIIAQLNKKGIFEMKDSVLLVADTLGISKNTVYLHLRNLREK